MKRLALSLALLSACGGDDGIRIGITVDIPAEDRGGALLQNLDALRFRVSDGRDFVATQLYRIEEGLPSELLLPDVPTGNQVVFDLAGLSGTATVAYGRTCRLVVNESVEAPFEARLYFSRVGYFRAGEEPIEPDRHDGLMFSDDRGRAIVTGGSALPVVELFDPREGQFDEAGEALTRVGGAIAVREDGTAIVAGGIDPEAEALVAAVEEIDPDSQSPEDRVRVIGPETQVAAERTGLALAPLPDRAILLTGGRTATGEVSGEIALLAESDDEFRTAGALGVARTGHTATVGLGGVTYLIGGLAHDPVGATDIAVGSIELYRAQDGSVRTLPVRLAVPRFGHTATMLWDGRILVVGGKVPRVGCSAPVDRDPQNCFDAVAAVEIIDPIAGEVSLVEDGIPGGLYDHTATVVAGGRVLIAGGFDGDHMPRADATLFDPDPEALVPTRALTSARAGHTATALCDDTVLLVGGVSDGETPLPSERYTPAPMDRP